LDIKFLHPRYWLIWLAVFLLRAIVLLPQSQRMWIGRQVGLLLYHISPKRRAVAAKNIELCFPDFQQQDIDKTVKKHFLSLGMSLIDNAACWWKSDRSIKDLAQIEGLEHLDKAVKEGRSVILLASHFNMLEFGLRLLKTNTSYPVFAVYQPNSNPLLDKLILEGRERNAKGMISYKEIRKMIRYLKQGQIIWYAPDQGYMGKYSEMVPFFGIPAASNTATSRLAKLSGAAVIPFFVRQSEDYKSYQLSLYPPMEEFPTNDPIADTERYHHLIEQEITKAPEQYLWVHRRFKNRPEQYPDVYQDIALRKKRKVIQTEG